MTKRAEKTQPAPFKLGFRYEEDWVKCYMISLVPKEKEDPPDEPLLLASIRRSMLEAHGAFEDYQALMTKSMAHALKMATGVTPSHWTTEPGPPRASDVKGDSVK